MPLEDLTGSNKYISNLVPTNPEETDTRTEGDNHLQGIKNVLLNTFPNITGPVTLTQDDLNSLANRAGELFDFAGTVAPSYAIERPSTPTNAPIASYPKLFAAIGTTWGAGDGSTTFGLPYIAANEVDVAASGNVATATVGQVLSHTHGVRGYVTNGAGNLNDSSADGSTPTSQQTIDQTPAGGTKNLAAGMRVLKCVRIE